VGEPAFVRAVEAHTLAGLVDGNRVDVLLNGDEIFPAMLAAIRSARTTITFANFVYEKGDVAQQMAEALAERCRAGVTVNVLLDAFGSLLMPAQYRQTLDDAGCRVVSYRPLKPFALDRFNFRNHRRILVVDGRIGFTGGTGIGSKWTGDGRRAGHWRQTDVRVEGPIVRQLQAAFAENWIEETGEIPAGAKYFPPPAPAGNVPAHLAYTSPTGGVSSVQVLYYLAIKAARHEIIIENPYLLPDDDAIEALAEAVRRGVEVKVMVPATSSTDSPIVQHASHHRFGILLQKGIKIWEYKKTLLHQKVIIVDGVWSCVGSTNFDRRALQLNDEISLGIVDPNIAAQLRAAFADDLRYAEPRSFEQWKHRGVWHKMMDGLAYLASSQL
jgi:cardiolipin synthase